MVSYSSPFFFHSDLSTNLPGDLLEDQIHRECFKDTEREKEFVQACVCDEEAVMSCFLREKENDNKHLLSDLLHGKT